MPVLQFLEFLAMQAILIFFSSDNAILLLASVAVFKFFQLASQMCEGSNVRTKRSTSPV